jgi:hypothetical protein
VSMGTAWISVILSLCMLAADGARPQSPQRVQQRGRFEAAIVNPRTYANPYEDAALNVIYHGPDGRVVRFWGFHDGNGTWRIRFMPDTPGTWRYEAGFSDGRPGPAGEFQCVSSDIPGMISVCDFFETVPFQRMRPHQDLVDNGYCLAEPGRQYLIYLEEPGAVNLNLPSGAYGVKWINARDTSDTRDGGTTTGVQSLVSPAGGDWLLYLTRVDEPRESSRPGVVTEDSLPNIHVGRLMPDGNATDR